jgi:hypothetical protein
VKEFLVTKQTTMVTFSREPIMPCDKPRKLLTVVFIVEETRILLGMKKVDL